MDTSQIRQKYNGSEVLSTYNHDGTPESHEVFDADGVSRGVYQSLGIAVRRCRQLAGTWPYEALLTPAELAVTPAVEGEP